MWKERETEAVQMRYSVAFVFNLYSLTNNWESYLIICFRTPKEVVFHQKTGMPLPFRQTSLTGSVLKIMLKRLSTVCWITCPSLQAPAHHTQGGSLLRRKKLLKPCSSLPWPLPSNQNSSSHHCLPLLIPAWMSSFNNFPRQPPHPQFLLPINLSVHPAEKEENMEICSDVSSLAHAHQACGQFDYRRFVCCSLHKPTNIPK